MIGKLHTVRDPASKRWMAFLRMTLSTPTHTCTLAY